MTTTRPLYLSQLEPYLDPAGLYSAADLTAELVTRGLTDDPHRARVILARHARRNGFPAAGDGTREVAGIPGPAWFGRRWLA